MINASIDELLTKADCRYTLVVEAAKRARQIVDGSPSLTETDEINAVSQAVKEILTDRIAYIRRREGIK